MCTLCDTQFFVVDQASSLTAGNALTCFCLLPKRYIKCLTELMQGASAQFLLITTYLYRKLQLLVFRSRDMDVCLLSTGGERRQILVHNASSVLHVTETTRSAFLLWITHSQKNYHLPIACLLCSCSERSANESRYMLRHVEPQNYKRHSNRLVVKWASLISLFQPAWYFRLTKPCNLHPDKRDYCYSQDGIRRHWRQARALRTTWTGKTFRGTAKGNHPDGIL